MQVFYTSTLGVLYYTSRSYAQQIEKVKEYKKLIPVIFIGFLDYIMFVNDPIYISKHFMVNTNTCEITLV
jgi:hypothetical protein